jgi:cell division protein FtsI/penicillin-binding protein 2
MRKQFLYTVVGLVSITATGWGIWAGGASRASGFQKNIKEPQHLPTWLKDQVAQAIQIRPGLLPSEVRAPAEGARGLASDSGAALTIQYTLDPELQDTMERLYQQYRPDYGAFAAIDPDTGAVLSMVTHTNDPNIKENLALRATYPSASIFKVITAAAALSKGGYSPESIIPFTGANHTLYKSHVLRDEIHPRWARRMSLKEAFGRSVNTVFGRIGAHRLGAGPLREYADRFGFDQTLGGDFPLQVGHADIQADAWELAEAASGFTKGNTMSPVHGALIAAAVVNGGKLMEPYLISNVHQADGSPIYVAQPRVKRSAISPSTAEDLKDLMRATITHGTSRKSFRGFAKGMFRSTEVGGKTGSLTGDNPRGKVDWFVGYADHRGKKIAVAALTIHGKLWRVKSSWLARRSMETYIKSQFADAKTPRRLASATAPATARRRR